MKQRPGSWGPERLWAVLVLAGSFGLLWGAEQANGGELDLSSSGRQHNDAARGMLRRAASLRNAKNAAQQKGKSPDPGSPAAKELTAEGDEDSQYSACSCDCCYAKETSDGLTAEQVKQGMVALACMPQAGANPLPSASRNGACAQQCLVEQDEAIQRFSSKSTAVDYARFCDADCKPAEDAVETQCVSADDDSVPDQDSSKPALSAVSTKMMPSSQAMTQTSSSLTQPGGSGAALPLAKGEMLEAMVHAKAAGEAAALAKESYEKVLRAARVAAEASGKAVLAEIKREAGEQAKAALMTRLNYEAAAKKNAQNAAIGIAKVYKGAMMRDQGIAGTWAMRSGEYATAAAQRKGMALQMAKDAANYIHTQEYGEAQAYLLQSQQAMEQARSFAGRSTAAHTQAVAINDKLKWYIWAEQAAAANALIANMPLDVAPPGMPPLP